MSTEIETLVNREYQHGFVTEIETDQFPPGLSEETVRLLSAKKEEPEWLLDWRLKAYRRWLTMKEPRWPNVSYEPIDYQAISYYSAPRSTKPLGSLDELDPKIRDTYDKLGIPLHEQKMIPCFASSALYVVPTETESNTASTATPASSFCSWSGMPSLS